jgi:hypothetical protein
MVGGFKSTRRIRGVEDIKLQSDGRLGLDRGNLCPGITTSLESDKYNPDGRMQSNVHLNLHRCLEIWHKMVLKQIEVA